MFIKKGFFVMFVVMVVFFFTSSIFASDAKKDESKPEAAAVKTEVGAKVKPAEQPPQTDVKALKTININKATAVELSSVLKKVGPKYAAAIVKYREENGEFKSPEDIKKVKGIGDKIYNLNKEIIVTQD